MPGPMRPSATNSTGNPRAWNCRPSSWARLAAAPPASPGSATPDRSPLTSATNTGTPAEDSCSAIPCSVLVLPVPVAPAMRPWRLTIRSGSLTVAPATTAPSCTPRPRSSAAPSVAYAVVIVCAKSAMPIPLGKCFRARSLRRRRAACQGRGGPGRLGMPPGHRHERAAERRVADVPAAAGRADDRVADGQPEPGSRVVLGGPVEPVEQERAFGLGDAGAAVLHGQADPPALGAD